MAPKSRRSKGLPSYFASTQVSQPSELVNEEDARACAQQVLDRFNKRGVHSFSVRLPGTGDYPDGLKDAEYPLQFLYYQGNWDLAYAPKRIAVVGTRNPDLRR